jgi:ribosomal protein S27AE
MSLFSWLFGKKSTIGVPEKWQKISDEYEAKGIELNVIVGKIGYEIIVKDGQRAIKCLRCGMTSWSAGDVDNLYCGNCRAFHERRKFI